MFRKLTIVNKYNTLNINKLTTFIYSKTGVFFYQFNIVYLGNSSVRGG